MKQTTTRVVRYRRKREGKTNYKKRLELLKGRKNRLVIRKTNTQLILQIIKYETDGDKVLITVQSKELKKHGWNYSTKSLPGAYLAGMLLAKKAKANKITDAILDLGLQLPLRGSRLYAALNGAIDGGLNIPANKEVFPSADRLKGEHIAKHLEKYKNLPVDFEKVKAELKK